MSAASGLSECAGEKGQSSPAPDTSSCFESIFLEHYGRVLRLLMRLTGNRTQAEDLANEVFLKLSRHSEHWLRTNNVGAWLYRTATHAGIDALRAAFHRQQYERAATDHACRHQPGEAGPLESLLREEDCKSVQLTLRKLKPAQAQLLLLRADGASYKEVAETLNVAVTGVGTLLNRAEAEFRKHHQKLTQKRKSL